MRLRELPVEGWLKVVHFEDDAAGLNAIIAVHDATLGPGCGGVRVHPYAHFDDALEDVKRLSRGMTFKNALGGIPFGGGKAVIIANPHTDKTPEMFRAFGRALNALNGLYYTAEDSGVSERDLAFTREVTQWVGGIGAGGLGGNPSTFTARGVWRGMVADVNAAAVEAARRDFGASAMTPEEAYGAPVDIVSPCALGGAINAERLSRLQARIVAGGANNQLATPDMDEGLRGRGVLYAPDYVINAAGVISVGLEILNQWSDAEMTRRIDAIGPLLVRTFERAEREGRPTGAVADDMARDVIAKARRAA
jgi:leucine dehydrogenase